MGRELNVAGFTLTTDEWEALDDESRALLHGAVAADDPGESFDLRDNPYEYYELTIYRSSAA